MVYIVFPIVAALFDKSIFKHLSFSLGYIIVLQFLKPHLSFSEFSKIGSDQIELLGIIITMYTITLSTVFIFFLHNENKIVKNIEIKRSNQLQEAYKKLTQKNKKIHKQKVKLDKLNATKNKFFSIISHDLKSPFNSILGLSELMVRKVPPEDKNYIYATQIHQTAEGLYKLLENLLEWAGSQLNHIKLNLENFNLHDLVLEILEGNRGWIQHKQIDVVSKIDPDMEVYADRNQIKTVIWNLFTNAIKFSWERGRIYIVAEKKASRIIISIADKGMGIPKEDINTLFKIEDKTPSRDGTKKEKGSGLGLLLSYEFIKNHNGRIWAKSKEGEGSTFYFTIEKARIEGVSLDT
jgi:signal transduction histidine kinase